MSVDETMNTSRGKGPVLMLLDTVRGDDYTFSPARRTVFSARENNWTVLYTGKRPAFPSGAFLSSTLAQLCNAYKTRSVLILTCPAPYKTEPAEQLPTAWRLLIRSRGGWFLDVAPLDLSAFSSYYDRVSHYEGWYILIVDDAFDPSPLEHEPLLTLTEVYERKRVPWRSLIMVENDFGQMWCLLDQSIEETGMAIANLLSSGLAHSGDVTT